LEPITTIATIAIKKLAELNLPGLDPASYWLKARASQLPYQIMAGIISRLDRMQGKFMDKATGPGCPEWLLPDMDIMESLPGVHWSKFQHTYPCGLTVRGVPDNRFRRRAGTVVITDNKTATLGEGQDRIRPLYEAQLNIEADIHEALTGDSFKS
jgi:hypothetical protein